MHKPRVLLPVPPIPKNAEALNSLTSLWLPWGGLDEAQAENKVSFRCGAKRTTLPAVSLMLPFAPSAGLHMFAIIVYPL
jgi:hypothetical protein